MLHRDEIPEWQQQLIRTERIEAASLDGANGAKLPFDDDHFDVVVSSMSLQWLNDIPAAMTEIHRVLKPDGCFLGAFSGTFCVESSFVDDVPFYLLSTSCSLNIF